MTTSKLIKEISKKSGISQADVKKVISGMITSVSESLIQLESVRIKNLCNIEPIIIPERKRVSNLVGNKKVLYQKKSVKVKFTISEQMQNLLQQVIMESKPIDVKEYFNNLNLE